MAQANYAKALWDKCGYKPHPKQLLFHNSTARFKVPVCGRRWGKSIAAAMEALPELLKPKSRGWIVGPSYALSEKEFRYIWDALIALKLLNKCPRKAYNVRTGEMYIETPMRSVVECKSADHPDGLVGEGLDWLIVSEAAKQKEVVWDKYLRPALADKKGWAIFPSTPEGFNWYHELYQKGQNYTPEDQVAKAKNILAGRDITQTEYESWNFPSWDNPFVYPQGEVDPEILSQKRSDDDPYFWQELGAQFRSFVGQIYNEWDDNTNIIDNYEYNPQWSNYLFFDFGFVHPFVALDVQISPSDDIYIWREYVETEKPVHKHAVALRDRVSPAGYRVLCGYGDAADPGAMEALSGIVCATTGTPDSKDVQRGITEIKRLLRDGDGNPHIFVSRQCPQTIWEFQNYRTKENSEQPVKFRDDCVDAVRYGIMNLFVAGSKYHLSDVMSNQSELLPTKPGELVGAQTIFSLDRNTVF